MNRRATLIFDGDDTLWKTHFLYKKVKYNVASILNLMGIDVDKDVFAQKVDELSVVYGEKNGFTSARFPTALTKTFIYFCQLHDINPSKEAKERIWELGTSVATMKPIIMPKARDVLVKLSKNNDCILYTLGNEKEQLFRIDSISLRHYFNEIFIVPRKNELALEQILLKHDLNPKLTWMIGNSAGKDIKPALNMGLNCIWLHSEHWLLDETDLDTSQVYEIKSLAEIPPILETWAQRRA